MSDDRIIVRIQADITDAERNLARIRSEWNNFQSDMRRGGGGAPLDDLTGGLRNAHGQAQILGASLRHAFDQIAAGGSPMQALLAQMGHLQNLVSLNGGVGGSMARLGALLGTAGGAAVALGGGLLAVGGAALYMGNAVSRENDRIRVQLAGLGQAAGLSVDGVRKVGAEVARMSNVSNADGRDLVTTIIGTGKISGANVAKVGDLAKGYAKLFGVELHKAGVDVSLGVIDFKGFEAVADKVGGVDANTREHIRALFDQGKQQDAVAASAAALRSRLDEAAQSTSKWERYVVALKEAWEKAEHAMGKVLDREHVETADERVERTRKDYEESQKPVIKKIVTAPPEPLGTPRGKFDGPGPRIDITPPPESVITEQPDPKVVARKKQEYDTALAEQETERRAANTRRLMAERTENSIAAARIIKEGEQRQEQRKKMVADEAQLQKVLDANDGNLTLHMMPHPDGQSDADQLKAVKEQIDAIRKSRDELDKVIKAGGPQLEDAVALQKFNDETIGKDRVTIERLRIEYDLKKKIRDIDRDQSNRSEHPRMIQAANEEAALLRSNLTKNNTERARGEADLPPGFIDTLFGRESSFNPNARPKNKDGTNRSSAFGYAQMIKATWLDQMRKLHPELFDQMDESQILALRSTNYQYNREAATNLSKENAVKLNRAGFDANGGNLRMMYMLQDDGIKMLQHPTANAASLAPDAARANPEVFKNGTATAQQVIDWAHNDYNRKGKGNIAAEGDIAATERETKAINELSAAKERHAAFDKAFAEAKERNILAANNYANGAEMEKKGLENLEPELQKVTQGFLDIAAAKTKANQEQVGAQAAFDLKKAYGALGRSSLEQSGFDFASQYGKEGDPGFAANQAAGSQLALMRELKSTASSALTGFVTDLIHGASAADALRNMLGRIADKLINMAMDKVISSLFGNLLGAVGGGATALASGGAVEGHATGGPIWGGGTATSDSIPAMLSNGEYVINAQQTAKHRNLIEAINSGRISRFADGGEVGSLLATRVVAPGPGGNRESKSDSAGPGMVNHFNTQVTVPPNTSPEDSAKIAKAVDAAIEAKIRKVQRREEGRTSQLRG